MTTAEVLEKVRKIEIRTKGLSNTLFSGEYHSAFKGKGMSFSEVREYAPGDDVRAIDWNVSARLSTPYVKVFEEEREQTLMLLVDISQSALIGSTTKSKRDLITEICAVLAFSAIANNDKVGILFFSHKVEKYIPPSKGKSHVLRLIKELITIEPVQSAHTDINTSLDYLNRVMKRRTIAFLISDYVAPTFEKALKISARRHDFIGIHIYDPLDEYLPEIGLFPLLDIETGEYIWVDTNDKKVRQQFRKKFLEHQEFCQTIFSKSGADLLTIGTEQDFVKKLNGFFIGRK